MRFDVSKSKLDESSLCDLDFQCVCSGKLGCVVESNVDDILFVKGNHKGCPYKLHFGSSKICTCPTRKEIYHRYNK